MTDDILKSIRKELDAMEKQIEEKKTEDFHENLTKSVDDFKNLGEFAEWIENQFGKTVITDDDEYGFNPPNFSDFTNQELEDWKTVASKFIELPGADIIFIRYAKNQISQINSILRSRRGDILNNAPGPVVEESTMKAHMQYDGDNEPLEKKTPTSENQNMFTKPDMPFSDSELKNMDDLSKLDEYESKLKKFYDQS